MEKEEAREEADAEMPKLGMIVNDLEEQEGISVRDNPDDEDEIPESAVFGADDMDSEEEE